MSAGVPSVAMADIAFNLVLFFIMMAKTQDDSHLQWRPAKGRSLASTPNSKVSVVVDRDRKLYFNGQQIGAKQLSGLLQAALGDLPPGNRTVLLKIDHECTSDFFEPVLEAVSEAGGDIVHILEQERP